MKNNNHSELERNIKELKEIIAKKKAEIVEKYVDKPEIVSMRELYNDIFQAQKPMYMCEIMSLYSYRDATVAERKSAMEKCVRRFNSLLNRKLENLTYAQMDKVYMGIRYGIGEKHYDEIKNLLERLEFSNIVSQYKKNIFIKVILDNACEAAELPECFEYSYELLGAKLVLERFLRELIAIEKHCTHDEMVVVALQLKKYE